MKEIETEAEIEGIRNYVAIPIDTPHPRYLERWQGNWIRREPSGD